MRRRPLCLAVVLLLMILWILPEDVWLKQPDIASGENLTVTGIVTKREQKEDKKVYYMKDCFTDSSDSKFSMIVYLAEDDSYPIGCTLSVYGTIYQLNKATNPGQFDAESYYQSQGILYTFQGEGVLSWEGENFWKEKTACLREYFAEKLADIYNERDSGILRAALLGDKSALREEDQLLYQKNGISHLLAISGLHISMIGISFYKFLRKIHCSYAEAGIPSGILLVLYGQMTGFGVSTLRAVCMFLVMIAADILGRAYDMASAMSLAALIILVRNPLQARQGAFLLSFGAVLGICFVYPILQSILQVKKKFSSTLLFSISITLVTYPVSVHFFYEYSLYSTLLNLIVIPCMSFVMGFGGISMLAECMIPGIGKWLGIPAHLILEFYEFLCSQMLRLPYAVLRLGCEELWQLILYYVLLILSLLLLWYDRRRIYNLLLPIAVAVVSLRFHSGLEFTMLDVGQGDCLFMRFPSGTVCLVDGGSTSVKNAGQYRILPYLKYEGIDVLDYVILSHLDEDHINGIRELIEMTGTLDGVEIEQIFFPAIANPDETYEELWELAVEKGIQVQTIGAGDSFVEEDVEMKCLYPVKNSISADKNDSSTTLQITYEKFTMLLTGDMGTSGEKELLRKNRVQDIDVWKVSHHGSKYSGGSDFLEVLRPNLSLISVGKNNYGHPSEELLKRLKAVNGYVRTTLESGAIRLRSDGISYYMIE